MNCKLFSCVFLFAACAAYGSQMSQTIALKMVQASSGTAMSYLSVVWGILSGYLVFSEVGHKLLSPKHMHKCSSHQRFMYVKIICVSYMSSSHNGFSSCTCLNARMIITCIHSHLESHLERQTAVQITCMHARMHNANIFKCTAGAQCIVIGRSMPCLQLHHCTWLCRAHITCRHEGTDTNALVAESWLISRKNAVCVQQHNGRSVASMFRTAWYVSEHRWQ